MLAVCAHFWSRVLPASSDDVCRRIFFAFRWPRMHCISFTCSRSGDTQRKAKLLSLETLQTGLSVSLGSSPTTILIPLLWWALATNFVHSCYLLPGIAHGQMGAVSTQALRDQGHRNDRVVSFHKGDPTVILQPQSWDGARSPCRCHYAESHSALSLLPERTFMHI